MAMIAYLHGKTALSLKHFVKELHDLRSKKQLTYLSVLNTQCQHNHMNKSYYEL